VEIAIARLDAERAGLVDKAAAAAQTAISQTIAELRVRFAEERRQQKVEPPALTDREKD
jgi:hypothetical protein